MSVAAVFGPEFDELGIWWPRGDGDALRASATAWRDTADLLEGTAAVLDVAAARVAEHHHGEAAGRFATLWSKWAGAQGHLAVTVADCRRIAAAISDFATDVDVADRAVVRLAEVALDANLVPILTLIDEVWRAWLGDQAALLGTQLGSRADAAAATLRSVDPDVVLQPDERAAIDPDAVTWPGLAPSRDLGHLTTTAVDFGAGPGDLPALAPTPGEMVDSPAPAAATWTPVPPVAVPPMCPVPPVAGWVPPGWQGAPNGWPVAGPVWPAAPTNVAPAGPAVQPWAPEPYEPLSAGPPVEPWEPVVWEPEPWEPAPADVSPTPAFEPTPPIDTWLPPAPIERRPIPPESTRTVEPVDPVDVDSFESGLEPPAPPVAITVDPPGAAIIAGAAGAAGVAAAAGGGSRMPFFPFMPMGGMTGGGGGDEASEPKRRVPRRHRGT